MDEIEDFFNNTYIPVGIILKLFEKNGLSDKKAMDDFTDLLTEIQQSNSVLRCIRRTEHGPRLIDNIIKMAKFVRHDDGKFSYYVYAEEDLEDELTVH